MEDQKLKALVDRSVKELKDSFSEDMAEIRRMLQEVVGKMAPTAPQSHDVRLPLSMEDRLVKISRFNGDDPATWVFQVEQYFTHYNIFSDHKLSLASLYLDGEALDWYCWLFRNKQIADWDHFVDKLFIRFRGRKVHDNRLALLRQFTTVDDYQERVAAIPSWSTIAISPSPQSWDERLDYNKLNSAHQMFDEKLDKTPDIIEELENATMLIKSDSAAMLAPQENEELFHSVLDKTKEETDFPVPKYFSEPLVYNNNEAHKVFDEFFARSTDVILESHKVVMMTTDTIEQNDYATDVGNQGKNEKEVTGNDLPQLVPAIGEIPPLWIGSIFSNFGDLVMFNMQHGLGIARCSEEMSGMLSTCRYDQLMNRGITDRFSRLGHASLILTLHLFPPDQCGLAFPFDPGSRLLTMFLRVTRNSIFCIASGDLNHDKLIMSTLWNSCIWVNIGQEQNIPDFLLYKSRELGREEKLQGLLEAFAARFLEQFPNILVNKDDVLLFAIFGVVHISKPTLSCLVFDPGSYLDYDTSVILPGKAVNRVLNDSYQRVASREMQPIAPPGIIRLPKLFRFLQQLLPQVIGGDFSLRRKISEQASGLKMALEGKEVTPIVCITWLQGCIKSMTNLIEKELCNFSMLEEIMIFFVAQGVPASYATVQTCENDHCRLTVIESELELVKGALFVAAYVVHKSMLDKSKSTSILASCEKFKTTTRLMCYHVHFGGHKRVEECIVAQQIQLAELGKTSGAAMGPPLLARSRAFLVIIFYQNHHCFPLLCDTPLEVNKNCRLRDPKSFTYLKHSYCYKIAGLTDAHSSVDINKVLKIEGLSKREQMTNFRIVASVMVLGNMKCSKGNEIVSSILQVDIVWFHLCTTIITLYTHSSLGRFNIILPAWLYSNLEDKVLIEEGSIVVNQVDFVRVYVLKGVNGTDLFGIIGPSKILDSFIWDPGPNINWLNRNRD